MVNLLLVDMMTIGDRRLQNMTGDYENALEARQGTVASMPDSMGRTKAVPNSDWRTMRDGYMKGSQDFYEFWIELNKDIGVRDAGVEPVIFEVSKQGNKTRIEAKYSLTGERRAMGNIAVEYTNARDFIRQLRPFSRKLTGGGSTGAADLGAAVETPPFPISFDAYPDTVSFRFPSTKGGAPPMPEGFSIRSQTKDSITVRLPDSSDTDRFYKVYIGTSGDFSAAKPYIGRGADRITASSRGDFLRAKTGGDDRTTAGGSLPWLDLTLRNLQSNTPYYLWITSQYYKNGAETAPVGPLEARTAAQ
jgi:hypothetical protein